jgi:hypothetical protein
MLPLRAERNQIEEYLVLPRFRHQQRALMLVQIAERMTLQGDKSW